MTAAWNYSKTLEENGLQPPSTIIDVGAHSSQMTKLLAMPSKIGVRILSFEPNPRLKPAGEHFELALSDSDGLANFSTPSNDTDWGTIKSVEKGQSTREVIKMRFDSLVNSKKIDIGSLPRPILVKVDTEGSELDALVGFGDYLEIVDYLVVEVENASDRGGNYNLLSMCRYLSDFKFDGCKILYSCYDGPESPAYSDIMFWRNS